MLECRAATSTGIFPICPFIAPETCNPDVHIGKHPSALRTCPCQRHDDDDEPRHRSLALIQATPPGGQSQPGLPKKHPYGRSRGSSSALAAPARPRGCEISMWEHPHRRHGFAGRSEAAAGGKGPLVQTEMPSAAAAANGRGNGFFLLFCLKDGVVFSSLTNVKVPI